MRSGDRVGHYQLVHLLGEGATSHVYSARDVRLGRLVALKVIKAEYARARGPDEVQREAALLAALEHPAIARLYEIGVHDARPWFALELIDGITLRQRLEDRPLSLNEACRVVRTVADALAAAHDKSLVHGDVKPENVVQARDGTTRLIDLGLARPLAAVADGLDGTPAYASRERWQGAPRSSADDIWSLGVVWFECLVGERPYSGNASQLREDFAAGTFVRVLRQKVPGAARIEAALARCLSLDPPARPTARALAAELDVALARERPPPAPEGPFRGLEPYQRVHAGRFTGRDAELAEVRQRLLSAPLLAVVGPSGVGKSSFVQAGVIAQAEDDGALPALLMRPGTDPFRALAKQLHHHASVSLVSAPATLALEPEDALAAKLRADPALLGRLLRERAGARERLLLLAVDQTEELWTQTKDPAARAAFCTALALAADDRHTPVRVVLTLRDDFLGHVAEALELASAVERGLFLLRPPGPRALKQVLTSSIEPYGYAFEDPAMIDEMVATGALPLLQFAALRLWEVRDEGRRLLTRAAYDGFGGVAGALADHAQRVLSEMPPEVAREARRVLLELVTPEGTRARAELAELGPDAAEALRRLIDARLVQRQEGEAGAPSVELVHESLATHWAALRRWREESRGDVELEKYLRTAAQRWASAGERAVDRLRGASLDEALAWRSRQTGTVAPGLERLLLASTEGERGRRRFRTRLRIAAVAALAGIAAVSTAAVVLVSREADLATASLATALLEGGEAALAREEPLEARAKLRAALEIADSIPARSLWNRLRHEPLYQHYRSTEMFYAVAFSPDGTSVATGGSGGVVHLIDAATGAEKSLATHPTGSGVMHLQFSRDGSTLISTGGDGRVVRWDFARGAAETLIEVPRVLCWRAALSPDGRQVAATFADGSVWLHDGQARRLGTHAAAATAVAFLSDGELLSAGGDGVKRWVLATGSSETVAGLSPRPAGLAVSRDHATVAVASAEGRVDLWTPKTGEVRTLYGHTRPPRDVAFDPSGRFIASAGWDGVRLWQLDTLESIEVEGHTDGVYGIAFDATGALLGSASVDRSVRVVRPELIAERLPTRHVDRVHGVNFSPDGRLLVSASADRTARIWHVATGLSRSLGRQHTYVQGALFVPGEPLTVATRTKDDVARLWNVETGETRPLAAPQGQRASTLFSPDGLELAAGAADGAIHRWKRSGEPISSWPGHLGPSEAVAYSKDGRYLASHGEDGTVRLWSLSTGDGRVLGKQKLPIHGGSFHPSGQWLATSGSREVYVWSTAGGPPKVLAASAAAVWVVTFSPDGSSLAAIGDDVSALVWSVADLDAPPLRVGEGMGANEVSFSSAGTLVTSSESDTVRFWAADGRPLLGAVPIFPSSQPCFLWPKLTEDDIAAAQHAGLARALKNRPPDCRAKWKDAPPELLACVETLDGMPSAAADGQSVLLPCKGQVERYGTKPLAFLGRAPRAAEPSEVVAGQARGFADGSVRVGDRARPPTGSAVTALAAAEDLVVIGHADGRLELWAPAHDLVVWSDWLHGGVAQLVATDAEVLASSQLGDFRHIELRALHDEPCAVLRAVRAFSRARWEDGRALLDEQPRGGRCGRK